MKSISVKDLAALGDATEIVDVREEDEYVAVRVPGARSIPLSRFVQSLDEVPASGTVYVMCAAGGRSAQATTYLEDQGTTPSTSPAGSCSGRTRDTPSTGADLTG